MRVANGLTNMQYRQMLYGLFYTARNHTYDILARYATHCQEQQDYNIHVVAIELLMFLAMIYMK